MPEKPFLGVGGGIYTRQSQLILNS